MVILTKRFGGALFWAALFFSVGTVDAQERVGVAVSSVNDVQGTLGGEVRQILVGENLRQNEVVETGAKSSTQLLFLDETTLTMGPDSKLMLDELVYDPNDSMKLSKMVLTPLVGALRFASGTSDKKAYQIKTNVGTIGVRGTIFSVVTQPEITTVVLERGAVIMTNLDGISAVLDTPGLSMSLVAAKKSDTQQSGVPPKAPPPTPPAPPSAAIAAKIATVMAPERVAAPVIQKIKGAVLKIQDVPKVPIKRQVVKEMARKMRQKWCGKKVFNATTQSFKAVRYRC